MDKMSEFVEETDDSTMSSSKIRLREALKISDIVQSGRSGFTFEMDPSHEIDTGEDYLDTEENEAESFYMKHYIGDKARPCKILMDSITVDEEAGDFEHIIPLMTDLVPEKVKKLVVHEEKGRLRDVVPKDGKVSYHCVIFAEGKQEPIDSSVARGVVNNLVFSSGQCIEGLFIGLQTMKVGEIAKFWIHYDLAYGAIGIPPRIPPKANILCVVQMLTALGKDDLGNALNMTRDERDSLPFNTILKTSEVLHTEGNDYFEMKDFKRAIQRYRKAIDILDNYSVVKMKDEEERSGLLGTLYANIAQAYLKDDQPGKACAACKLGLKIPSHPQRHKFFFRFAKGKMMFKEYGDSANLCKKALDCLSMNQVDDRKVIETYRTKILKLLEVEEQELNKLYKNMAMGSKKDDKPKEDEPN